MTRKDHADKNKDPVCGQRMNRNKAYFSVIHKGQMYLLCCPKCQAEFEREPDKYAEAKAVGS